jgi:two-component system, OmpR family, phosphate regulon sensor histidine kinase PhoR
LSNNSKDQSVPASLRRRDVMAFVALASAILLIFAFTSALHFWEAVAGMLAISALSAIYYLLVRIPTSPPTENADETGDVSEAQRLGQLARATLNLLPFPVALIGPGGRIEQANPAARDFLGLGNEGGLLSATLRQPKVLEAVSSALRGEVGKPVEYSTVAPIESHVRAHIISLKAGEDPFPWRALLVLADETSIKRAERMRADFLANASHELRTPLASLAGFIETLKGHAREDVAARDRFLGIMEDQTERMRRLINDLLSLSRVEMDEHVAPSERVDLTAIAGDTIDALGPLLSERSATVTIESAGPALAIGDRDQLIEVIQNLLENAIKYSPEDRPIEIEIQADLSREAAEKPVMASGPNSGRLTIAATTTGPTRRFSIIRVRDHGAGIERRNLPRLSERFYRVDGQKSGPKEGTGLGLAIVKHIVSRHRGGFLVESELGVGTVFTIMLPAP